MARTYLFADEAGNFDFSAKGSRYFILTSVVMDNCDIGSQLLELRRSIAWSGHPLGDGFHATTDKQAVRDAVFALLARRDFRIDATVYEKRKALPSLHDEDRFYAFAWHYHMRHLAPLIGNADGELLVVGASLGTRRKQEALLRAIQEVVEQTRQVADARVGFWSATSDPCLQVADYCSWAIQRKWERQDDRSYRLIAPKIATEYEFFQWGHKPRTDSAT